MNRMKNKMKKILLLSVTIFLAAYCGHKHDEHHALKLQLLPENNRVQVEVVLHREMLNSSENAVDEFISQLDEIISPSQGKCESSEPETDILKEGHHETVLVSYTLECSEQVDALNVNFQKSLKNIELVSYEIINSGGAVKGHLETDGRIDLQP